MAAYGMQLRSGRVVGLAPPPGPALPPAPIPAGPLPPGIPALNTLIGLPLVLRMPILEGVFQGQPRMDLEDLLRPRDLGSLCLVNRQLKVEATEAFFRVSCFEVTVLTAMQDIFLWHAEIEWGQINPDPTRIWTLQEFRRHVARAQPLLPSRASRSWGFAPFYRIARSAGTFPWNTCCQWVKDAGPFIRDVDFNIMAPIRGCTPIVSPARNFSLLWDRQLRGELNLRVLLGAGAVVTIDGLYPSYPAGPCPPGLFVPAQPGVPVAGWLNIEYDSFDGYFERATDEANRLRQSYLPAVLAPGAPGFTGFTLRDLRSISKSFSEPSIYAIPD